MAADVMFRNLHGRIDNAMVINLATKNIVLDSGTFSGLSSTAITCTLASNAAPGTSCNDTTHTADVSAGGLVALEIGGSGNSSSANYHWMIEIVPQ